jgi:hypothetical protein
MERLRQIFLFFCLIFSTCLYAQVNSQFIIRNESFLSPQFEATARSQYQFVGLSLENAIDSKWVVLDSEAVMAVGTPLLNYVNFREASLVFPSGDHNTLILGRKKWMWSELDESWALGTIEPVFKWNPLNRESQGLTGLFWVTQLPLFQFTAFVSPVFLPDQGPSFRIDGEGQFIKGNPWFQMPPRTFQPFPGSNASSIIQYQVNKPSESEVVAQTSMGGSVEGSLIENFTWRASHFSKPMNQLALGYDGVYNTGTNEGEVEILPQVGFHRVTSADLTYDLENLRFGLSYLWDRPEVLSFDPEWTAPAFSEAQVFSPHVQFNYKKHTIRFDYLRMEGGEVREVGEFASSDRAPISSRFPFREALRGRYEFEMPLKKFQRIRMAVSWTHSDLNQFDLIQTRGTYKFSRLWQGYFDMQLLRARELTARNSNEISPYENNDRLMIGMSYEL